MGVDDTADKEAHKLTEGVTRLKSNDDTRVREQAARQELPEQENDKQTQKRDADAAETSCPPYEYRRQKRLSADSDSVRASSRACSASRLSVLAALLNADDLLALEGFIFRNIKRTRSTGYVIRFPDQRILYQIFGRVIARKIRQETGVAFDLRFFDLIH